MAFNKTVASLEQNQAKCHMVAHHQTTAMKEMQIMIASQLVLPTERKSPIFPTSALLQLAQGL